MSIFPFKIIATPLIQPEIDINALEFTQARTYCQENPVDLVLADSLTDITGLDNATRSLSIRSPTEYQAGLEMDGRRGSIRKETRNSASSCSPNAESTDIV